MKKLINALIAAVVCAHGAYAQSSPNWQTGYVPTAAQWNAEFASKQDVLSLGAGVSTSLSLPLNTAGGLLTTAGTPSTIQRGPIFSFNGVTSQWPWQLNTDGSWTLKQPQIADLSDASLVGPLYATSAVLAAATPSAAFAYFNVAETVFGNRCPLRYQHNTSATGLYGELTLATTPVTYATPLYSRPVNLCEWGAGAGASDDSTAINAAYSWAGDFSEVVFRAGDTYTVTHSIVPTHQTHTTAYGAVINGALAAGSDLLAYRITTPTGSDVRGLTIRGGRWIVMSGGQSAISINGTSGSYLPVLGAVIRDVYGAGFTGQDIVLYGEVGHSTIETSHLVGPSGNVLLSGVPDNNRITRSFLGGAGRGVEIHAQQGAWQTSVDNNTIVTGKAAVAVVDGEQVNIENNDIEQLGVANSDLAGAEIIVQGVTFKARSVRIRGNNIGQGTNIGSGIYADNTIDLLIEHNVHGPLGSGADINITANSETATINGDTGWGTRSGTTNLTNWLLIYDAGVETRGSWIVPPLSNGWTGSSDFGALKTRDDNAIFGGLLSVGTATTGTLVMTLPVGMRPNNYTVWHLPASATGAVAPAVEFDVAPSGAVTVRGSIAAGTTTVYLDGLRMLTPANTYSSTP